MKFDKLYKEFIEAILNIECAWCNKPLGTKDDNTTKKSTGEKTHGICKKCMKDVLGGWKKDKEKKDKENKL